MPESARVRINAWALSIVVSFVVGVIVYGQRRGGLAGHCLYRLERVEMHVQFRVEPVQYLRCEVVLLL